VDQFDPQELPTGEFIRYLQLAGRKGSQTLSMLGRLNKHFDSVIRSEVGREILVSDIRRLEELMDKVISETASEEEKAELRYLRKVRIPNLVSKVNTYLEKLGEVKKVVNIK
jgi:hypothetical protein